MKIKKITFLIIAISMALCSPKLYSQNWYIGFGGGYGFPAAGQVITSDGYNTSYGGVYTTQTLSFGKGIDASLFGGRMFNKNIGMELGVSYLDGAGTSYTSSIDIYNTGLTFDNVTVKGNMIRLMPGIRFQCGEGRIRPYSVMAFIVGFATGVTSINSDPNEVDTYAGGYSFGFHGALGARVMFSEKISAFIELAVNFQNYAPAKLVSNTGNEIDFENAGSFYGGSGNVTHAPIVHLPFSSVGGNVGIHYSFIKQPKVEVK